MSALANAITTAKVAYQAGFRGSSLIAAVAIAGAESGFNKNATGDVDLQNNKWGPSVGLWQIRTLKPEYLDQDPVRDINELYDPLSNARAAFYISKQGTNFTPWSVYLNNRYQSYESIARDAIAELEQPNNKVPVLVIISIIILTLFILK